MNERTCHNKRKVRLGKETIKLIDCWLLVIIFLEYIIQYYSSQVFLGNDMAAANNSKGILIFKKH